MTSKPRWSADIERGPHRDGKPDRWVVFEQISEFGRAVRIHCADEAEARRIAAEKNAETDGKAV